MLSIRPALSEDEPFLFQLFEESRKQEFLNTGWPEEQMSSFLHMQFEAQKRSYQLQNPSAAHEIIIYRQNRIGRLITDITDSSIHILDLTLSGKCRNRGFGASLLEGLQQAAVTTGRNVTLHVFETNSAQNLYLRLGFRITRSETPYVRMEWQPHS
ncbi:GNAT family N-acetyltransferase [Cohnella pontilimi]|nr:N-acetyltransferase [Cohnella pontilimi]